MSHVHLSIKKVKFVSARGFLKKRSCILALDGVSRTLQINVANVGSESGEEEML